MNDPYEKLKQTFGDRLKENEPMARYTTLKIGGPADLFYEARESDELVAIIKEARRLGIPIFLLGGGSNILVGDRGIRGLVVKNSTQRIAIVGAKGTYSPNGAKGKVFVEADSGVMMNKLVRFTIEEGLAGLEMHLGLPGTVGGAMYMNSKWTKPVGFIGDVVYQATILTADNEVKTVPQSYFRFGYDASILQTSADCVIRVVFALTSEDKEAIWDRANAVVSYRRESQPQGVFSPGCTFRNITRGQALSVPTPGGTTSAGFLLDHAGLKGKQVGGAQISPVHANFIINRGKATAADVVQLIESARESVKRQFGVTLQEEIVRVGEF